MNASGTGGRAVSSCSPQVLIMYLCLYVEVVEETSEEEAVVRWRDRESQDRHRDEVEREGKRAGSSLELWRSGQPARAPPQYRPAISSLPMCFNHVLRCYLSLFVCLVQASLTNSCFISACVPSPGSKDEQFLSPPFSARLHLFHPRYHHLTSAVPAAALSHHVL